MTERTVVVRFKGITTDLQAKLAEAGVGVKALETKVAGFHTQMQKSDLSAKGLLGTLGSLSAGELAVGAAAAVGGALTVKAVKSGVAAYIELVDQVRNYQRVTGASAEESSIMVARANALGVSTDSLATSMFRLSQNVETNKTELAAHGVEIAHNADGTVNLVRTFDSLADAYRRTGSGQEANRITQLALSRGAIQLLPLLAATRDRLKEIDAAAREHHEMVTDGDIAKALDYKIAIHEMTEAWVGIEREIGGAVVPALTDAAHSITEIIDNLNSIASKGSPVTDRLGGAGQMLGGFEKDTIRASVVLDVLRGHFRGAVTDLVPFGNSLSNLFFHHHKAASAADEQARAEEKLKQQIKDNDQAVKEYSDNLDLMFSSTFGVSALTDKFETGLAGAYTKLKEAKDAGNAYATSLSTSTTTGLANRTMLQGLAGDLEAAAKKYKELHPDATDDEIRRALSNQIGQLSVLLTYFSGDNVEAKNLRDTLNQIAGLDLSKPGKTYNYGFTGKYDHSRAVSIITGGVNAPPPPTDTTPPPDKVDPSGYLNALFEQRMEQIKNRFHAGLATLAEYQHSLDEQLAKEKPWTDKWVALQQEKADAVHYWTDAASKYLEALAAKQASIEDNMYKVGDLAADQYDLILHRRLASLQKYSDEWTAVYEQIQQIEGDALDSQLKLIEAYDAGLQFQKALDATIQGSYFTPAGGGGGTTTISSGSTYSPTFQISSTDPTGSAVTANQMLRDYAAMVG